MILEKNNLQTVQEWIKSYIDLIPLYAHIKNRNNLRSYIRDIMALDHSRLGQENKFLENKSGRIFCVRQVYLPTNLGACKPTFYTFYTSHLRWNSTLRRCFIIQTSDRMQYFRILQYKFHSFNIQDDGSTRGLLAKSFKNFQNHLYGQPALTFDNRQMNEQL